MYINFIGSYGIETIECLKGLNRKERFSLLKEYCLTGGNYYISMRATKAYYQNKQGVK